MHNSLQDWKTLDIQQTHPITARRVSAVEAARRAMLEAAYPPDLIFRAADATSTLPVQRVFALQELLITIDRLCRHKGDWFKVRRQNGTDLLAVSPHGRRLLELLAFLAPDAIQGNFQRRIEPRLQLAFECAAASLPLSTDSNALMFRLEQNPRGSMSILSGLISQIRDGLAKREIDNRVRRHNARDESFLRDIKAYFKDLATRYPSAIVLRQELRRWSALPSLYPTQAARESHELMSFWLESIKRGHKDAIVGHAWRLQGDSYDGIHHHVLLVLDGPSSNDLQELSRSCGTTWAETAGSYARFLDCKGPRVDLMFRGRPAPFSGDTLQQELHDAAVYFSSTDGLVAADFDEQPPQRGFKSNPKVLRASMPFSRI